MNLIEDSPLLLSFASPTYAHILKLQHFVCSILNALLCVEPVVWILPSKKKHLCGVIYNQNGSSVKWIGYFFLHFSNRMINLIVFKDNPLARLQDKWFVQWLGTIKIMMKLCFSSRRVISFNANYSCVVGSIGVNSLSGNILCLMYVFTILYSWAIKINLFW